MLNNTEELKKKAGKKAVDYIEDGMTIGLGSGSTVYWMMKQLGERIAQGLQVRGVPSSVRTEAWARKFGIPLAYFSEVNRLDLAIDGADEVDPDFQLIKGGGGSLLREKLVADAAKKLIIIVDESKQVQKLGNFPLPVEVVRFGWENTARKLSALGCNPKLRKVEGEAFVSNNDNYILDCSFDDLSKPKEIHQRLKLTLGVVETGLFIGMTNKVIVGRKRCVEVLER
ncbi:ribose-5-phosphate isomerase RpiA [Virgibacillus senegalensis]|uniref:ribose-5-phosphate isomerase RpiA n=1 Tax=Virgibacillus senegalensis TaxID=1499679 RepID=UPI00069D448E|nr:ribose-5-phosphate isomerase RpiA [Virgibacillus senegalensis]